MKGANSPCELMPGRWLGGKQLAALCAHFGYFPATNLATHRELTDRRWTDSDAIISYCFNWRPQGDSNPCYRRERGARRKLSLTAVNAKPCNCRVFANDGQPS